MRAALAGRYRLERELGRGGMATVYQAHDERHDRLVAIKVLKPEIAEALGPERFLREIRTAARLSHPQIVTLHDSGEVAGFLYYVMPLIRGESLRQRLERERRLAIPEALALARQVAGALDYAHREGVLHRDIKPENILLHEGQPLLADFGIALARQSSDPGRLTETGMSLGTPHYMSPEQALGDPEIDGRADLYSLGCVLYELLTGNVPFSGPTREAALVRRLTERAPSVRSERAEVPEWIERAVARALAKEPADRFPSAAAMAESLVEPRAPIAAQAPSIVVLPFDNLSPDPDNAYFAEGLTEELISDLSKVKALRVTSRNSAIAAKGRTKNVREIAQLLKVRYVLEGSVRRAGRDLRITAQLIDGTTDTHLWAEKYAGTVDDVFDLQEKLSRTIVDALAIQLTPQESRRLALRPLPDPRAYECYLRAKQLIWRYEPAANREAEALLGQAMDSMPDNALLHATIGWLYCQDVNIGVAGPVEVAPRATEHIERALALDPECGLAWTCKGWMLAMGLKGETEGRVQQELLLLRYAADLDSDPVAIATATWCCWLVGWENEGAAWGERLMALDPLTSVNVILASCGPLTKGDMETTLTTAERGYRLAPTRGVSSFWRGWCLAYAGRESAAIADLRGARDLGGWGHLAVVLAAALEGDEAGAIRSFREGADLVSHNPQWMLHAAEVLARANRIDESLDWLDRAVKSGVVNWRFMSEYDPLLAPLRGHPRFEALMAEAKNRQAEFLALHGERGAQPPAASAGTR